MKTSLKVIALLLAAGFPCVAFAEMLGASIPAVANVENVTVAFCAVILGLTLVTDYTRPTRALNLTKPVLATTPRAASRENHRLAA